MISQNTTDLLGMQPDHTEDSEADIFDQAFTAAVLSIALDFVEGILLQRIKQEGVRISNRQTKNLRSQLEQIARGERTAVSIAIRRWKWWNNDDIAIELSEDDLQNLDEMTGKLIAESPKILEDSVEPISEVIFQTLQKSWPKYSRTQDKDLSGFHKRLNDAWGKGLSLLDMLIVIATEIGSDLAISAPNRPKVSYCNSRLHARACQTAREAMVLMRHGFADGAMARWRTLHEIAVVMTFLYDSGEGVAERYIDYQSIESWRSASKYQEVCRALGQDPVPEEEMEVLRQSYVMTLKKYGQRFGKPYGWAAEGLGKQSPTFGDMERVVSLGHMRPYYKLASNNIHADPQGTFFRLGTHGEEMLLAGASNAGIADPGHNVAISLHQATVCLVLEKLSYDHLLGLTIMQRLTDDVGEALIESHMALEKRIPEHDTSAIAGE